MAAKTRGWEPYGVEPAPIAAAQAERLVGVPIHRGTLDTVTYPEGWFDVVTMWDVIEHVQSPSSYVAQVARLLRPGGMFALTTPNIRSLSYILLGRDWWVVGPNGHLFYFSPRTIHKLLSRYGFAIHTLSTMSDHEESLRLWLRYRPLQRLVPLANGLANWISNRYLLGEGLLVIGRKL